MSDEPKRNRRSWALLQQIFGALADVPLRERLELLTIAWNATAAGTGGPAPSSGPPIGSFATHHMIVLG